MKYGTPEEQELLEELYEKLSKKDSELYRVLDSEGVNMADATVYVVGDIAVYADSVNGYAILTMEQLEMLITIPESEYKE